MPRISLPSVNFGRLTGPGGRKVLLYSVYTLVLFAAFLLTTFPYEALVRMLLRDTPQAGRGVQFETVRFVGWKGFAISGLRVSPQAEGAAPVLEFQQLWLRPALGQWIRGNPYALHFAAELYGGTADGDVSMKEGSIASDVQWNGLRLESYPPLKVALQEATLNGRLGGQVSFEGRLGKLENGQGAGELMVDSATLAAGQVSGVSVPNFNLKQSRLKFKLASGRLDIVEFTAGGDISVQASGQIGLRQPLFDSTLTLRATLLPTATTPDALKGALALIPRAPGAKLDAPVNIAGTLGRPRLR